MKKALALVAVLLVACGSVPDADTDAPDGSPAPQNPSDPPKNHRGFVFGSFEAVDASSDAPSDSGSDAIADAGAPDVQSDLADAQCEPDATTCAPTIGHCLTDMATWCYETTDVVSQCAGGLTSGWSSGPCDTANSTGGCIVGCQVSYYYRLGGLAPDQTSRDGVKADCEGAGGTYIDLSGDAGTGG